MLALGCNMFREYAMMVLTPAPPTHGRGGMVASSRSDSKDAISIQGPHNKPDATLDQPIDRSRDDSSLVRRQSQVI